MLKQVECMQYNVKVKAIIYLINNVKRTLPAGFEPAREYPNGFRVHRLNHSATTT